MKNRSELREIIMKVIYQIKILDDAKIEYDIDDLIHEQLEVENDFVNKSVSGILDNEKEIISLANKYLKEWKLDRLNKVDQAILELGIYELMFTDTPSVVCINEAIELANKYSDPKVSKMINACLDKIYHEEIENNEE